MAKKTKTKKGGTGIQGDVRLVRAEHKVATENPATVLIPNVSVFDGTSDKLKTKMNVLVVDNKIKKISKTAIKAAKKDHRLENNSGPGPDAGTYRRPLPFERLKN